MHVCVSGRQHSSWHPHVTQSLSQGALEASMSLGSSRGEYWSKSVWCMAVTAFLSCNLGQWWGAQVYKGTLNSTVPVVLKVFTSEGLPTNDPRDLEVLREIRHPNIVHLVECCVRDRCALLAMECVHPPLPVACSPGAALTGVAAPPAVCPLPMLACRTRCHCQLQWRCAAVVVGRLCGADSEPTLLTGMWRAEHCGERYTAQHGRTICSGGPGTSQLPPLMQPAMAPVSQCMCRHVINS